MSPRLPGDRVRHLLNQERARNRLAARSMRRFGGGPNNVEASVVPLEDVIRAYTARLTHARSIGLRVKGSSTLLKSLRQCELEKVLVFTETVEGETLIFFADPDLDSLIAAIAIPVRGDAAAASAG
jgi:hypothetical protein